MFSNDNSRALVNYSLIVLTLVLSNAANSPVGYNPLVAPAPQNSNDTAYAEASSSTLPLPTTLKLSVSRQTAPPTISPYSGVDSARVTDPQPLASSPAAIPSESELKGILPGVVKSLRPLVGSISHTLSATAQQSPQVGAGKNGCQTAECFIKYPVNSSAKPFMPFDLHEYRQLTYIIGQPAPRTPPAYPQSPIDQRLRRSATPTGELKPPRN